MQLTRVEMARNRALMADGTQGGLVNFADRHGARATGVEAASRRWPESTRHLTCDDGTRPACLDLRIGNRDSRHQRFGVRMQRAAIEIVAVRDLHDSAEI